MSITARLSTALADRYKIESHLGAGGMANVYLAHDLKHDRKVAVKVLRPELAAVLGAERFVQEIKTTANLQHPHILPLFDSGEADSFLYYVMPFIDGETLRDKLNRETQLGIEEAVNITTAIADALDYAHRQNVIHRDIKPENILLHDGRPMVADFGIALALSAAAGGRMTETGMSLGTPHYMSPEQATADRDLTNRSDIYSLGAVLYEMLTGDPPHTASSAQAIVMKIVADEVRPVTEMRKSVPLHVAAATTKALEKLAADRFGTASEFAEGLTNPAFRLAGGTRSGVAATPVGHGFPVWRFRAMAAIAVVAVIVAWWAFATRPEASRGQVLRVSLDVPDGIVLAPPRSGSRVAVSPDGANIVFVGEPIDGATPETLWLRPRGELRATPLPGTEDAFAPFFSPDGLRVGFYSDYPPRLEVLALDGRSPNTLARFSDARLSDSENTGALAINLGVDRAAMATGAVWGPDGSIYAASNRGVVRIPVDGGPRTLVSVVDSTANEQDHVPTDVLPNGRGLIVTVTHRPNALTELYDVAVLDLRTGVHRVLVRGYAGRYAVSGHLVVAQAGGDLLAAPFDQEALELTGDPASVIQDLEAGTSVTDFALSETGMLTYVLSAGTRGLAELVWVRLDGTVTSADPEWRADFRSVAIAPDGMRVAVSVETRLGAEIWLAQLEGGPRTRLPLDGTVNQFPTWSRDGRVVFASNRNGRFELLAKREDGVGPAETLVAGQRGIVQGMVSPDGQWYIYRTHASGPGGSDILAKQLGDSMTVPLVATDRAERYPALSPDGRWLAYRSSVNQSPELYVRPFPNVEDGVWQVSQGGGSEPVWAPSGRQLFYVNNANELVSATVQTEPVFAVSDLNVLFPLPARMRRSVSVNTYDVSRDGSRFLMIRYAPRGVVEQVVLVEHWFEELRELVPR